MFTLHDILQATGGSLIAGSGDASFPFSAASIDSRTINEGELFIPLKGTRSDGHEYIGQALLKGAGSLTEKELSIKMGKNKYLIKVENTLKALQKLAHFIRMKRPGMPLVGITGSNGKTTTKELAACVLERKFRVLKSEGNLNNQIGLPLNLARLSPEEDVAVLEMGASIPGDIKELCEIANPTHAILTNIGQSHLEGFGSMDMLLRTKLELADAAPMIAYNADDPLLAPAVKAYKGKILFGFGMGKGADLKAENISFKEKGSQFMLMGAGESLQVKLNIPGSFNIYNALAAAACGILFNVPFADIARAFESFEGVAMRYEIKELRGALFLNDVYNANPASMQEALKELKRLRGEKGGEGRAVAVLGDMLELGPYAEEAHRELGRLMKKEVDVFIGVGLLMNFASEEFKSNGNISFLCGDPEEAGRALLNSLKKGDTVLIKGSRGMKMEKVLEGEG